MKSQQHNEGPLKELKVEIEQDVVDSFTEMSKNSGIPLADLVVTALKRFRASHSDYLGKEYKAE